MTKTLLGFRQVFNLTRQSLEKRFWAYFKETDDAEYIIECAVAAQVRNAHSKEDFSFLAKDLIRSLLLTGERLPSKNHLCLFFRGYFSEDEWRSVLVRQFECPGDYLSAANKYAPTIRSLGPLLSSGSRDVPDRATLIARFKDGAGYFHEIKIKNAIIDISPYDTRELSRVLILLTGLKRNGVRSFVKAISANRERIIEVRKNDLVFINDRLGDKPLFSREWFINDK